MQIVAIITGDIPAFVSGIIGLVFLNDAEVKGFLEAGSAPPEVEATGRRQDHGPACPVSAETPQPVREKQSRLNKS